MTRKAVEQVPLILPAELAQLFGVHPKTVLRWVRLKYVPALMTSGGHHRFHPDEVRWLLETQYTGDALNRRLKDLDDLLAAKQ